MAFVTHPQPQGQAKADRGAIIALVGPLGRLAARAVGAKGVYGMTLAALTAKFLSNSRR